MHYILSLSLSLSLFHEISINYLTSLIRSRVQYIYCKTFKNTNSISDEKKVVFKALLEIMTKELKNDETAAAESAEESDQADTRDSADGEGVMSEAVMEINSPDQGLGAEWWGYKPTKPRQPTKPITPTKPTRPTKPTKPTSPTRPTTVCPTAPTTASATPTNPATTAPTTTGTAPTTTGTAPTTTGTAPTTTGTTATNSPATTANTPITASVPPPAALKYSAEELVAAIEAALTKLSGDMK